MSVLALSYKAKKRVTPVLDQLTEDSNTSTECVSTMVITVTPSGTKYIEVVSAGTANTNSTVSDGNISVPTEITLTVSAFKSFQASQNTLESSIKINVRASSGGTIEDSIILYRDHTANIC